MNNNHNSDRSATTAGVLEILLLSSNNVKMGEVLSVLHEKGFDAVYEDDMLLFSQEHINISILHARTPVPEHEAESAIRYSMGWLEKFQKEIPHKGHLIVSVSCGSIVQERNLQSLIIFTLIGANKIAAVYNPSAKLIIPPRNFSESYASSLKHGVNTSPMIWLNIAVTTQDDKSFGYVYGLHTYGKSNYEVVASDVPVPDLMNFLVNIAAYLLEYDTNIKAGETIGFSNDEKLVITPSQNAFLGSGSVRIHF